VVDEVIKDNCKNILGIEAENIHFSGYNVPDYDFVPDIMLAKDFDSNFVGMYEYSALGLFDGTIIPHYTHQNLSQYISNTEEHILSRYKVIYSVNNEETVVIDTEQDKK